MGLQRVRHDLATEQQGELKFNQYFLVVIWVQGQRSQIDALQDADSRFKRWDSMWQSRFPDSLGKSAALALLGLNSYTALSWGREATYRTWALKFTPCFSSTQPAPLTYTHHPFDILKYLNFQPFAYTGKTSTTLISQLLTKWSCFLGFPGGSVVKNLPGNAGDAGDVGSIPRLGRSPG